MWCANEQCMRPDIPLKKYIKPLSSLVLALGVIETVVGLLPFLFVSYAPIRGGSWWAGFLAAIAGFLGVIMDKRGILFALCISASIMTAVVGIGLGVDLASYAIADTLQACYNPTNNQYYGELDYYYIAYICSFDYAEANCACAIEYDCYLYQLAEGADCGGLMGEYPDQLGGSFAMLVLTLIALLVLSIMACAALCCMSGPSPYTASSDPALAALADGAAGRQQRQNEHQRYRGRLRPIVLSPNGGLPVPTVEDASEYDTIDLDGGGGGRSGGGSGGEGDMAPAVVVIEMAHTHNNTRTTSGDFRHQNNRTDKDGGGAGKMLV